MLRSISNSFYNASSSFVRTAAASQDGQQDSSGDDQPEPPRSILKKSNYQQQQTYDSEESPIKAQANASVARNVTFSESTHYNDSVDAQPLSDLALGGGNKEYSNLFDASLGPPQDSYAQQQEEEEDQGQAESSATVAPQPKVRRASTTPVRSPPQSKSKDAETEDSVYYTASKDEDHSHLDVVDPSADQSEAPDLESSPSHRPAARPRKAAVKPLKLTLSQASASSASNGGVLDRFSLSEVMDDSPVHESMRFEFSELPPSEGEASIMEEEEQQQQQHSVAPSVNESMPPNDEPQLGRRSVSVPAAVPSTSKAEDGDMGLATDLESVLASQSDLIELSSVQRRSLLSLARAMRSHILTQATTIRSLKADKAHAEKGWTEAIDQVEVWEAQRVCQGEAYTQLQERVEMQEAESRRQMARSKEVEMEARKKAQEDVQRVRHELDQVQREHSVEFEVLKQAYENQAAEAKDVALAELKKQLADVKERHQSELAQVRAELSGTSAGEVKNMQEQLDAALSRTRELEIDLERESTARQRSDEAVQASQSQHQSLLSELESMEQAIAERDQFSEQLEKEHESMAHDFRVEIDALRKRLAAAQDDLARAEEGATGQMDVLGRHGERIAALEDEVRVVAKQKEDFEGEVTQWEERCKALEGVLQEKHALQDELERLKATVGKLRMQSADTDVKIVRLQKQRQKLKAEVEDLQMGLDAKQIEIQFLKRKRSLRPSLAPTTANASKTVSVSVSGSHSDLASVQDTPLPTTTTANRGTKGESTVKRDPAKPRRISFGAVPSAVPSSRRQSLAASASISSNKENTMSALDRVAVPA